VELKGILQAQAVWFLRPSGSYGYLPTVVASLVDEFHFVKAPTGEELLNLTPNAATVFRHGTYEIGGRTVVIDPLQIYPAGVLAGANTSTDDAEAFLGYLVEWAAKNFKIEYRKYAPPAYNSQLEVKLSRPLSEYFPQLKAFSEAASQLIPEFFKNKPSYEMAGITLSFDRLKFLPAPSNVRLERRENAPYEDNIYFSEGPFKTDDHLRLLETFERTLAG
jgi:hypothetical protein